jgi:hypothetical protein
VLWSVLVFYFVNRSCQNLNLNWTQISLQIMKRFEKEKDFLTPIRQWAKTRLVAEPGPTSPSFPLPLSLYLRSPWSGPPDQFSRSPADPAALPGFPWTINDSIRHNTCYWPDTPNLTRTRVRPNRFTPFVISPWPSQFGAGLEIRKTRLRVPYILDHFPKLHFSPCKFYI